MKCVESTVELDSVEQSAGLTEECAQSVFELPEYIQGQDSGPTETFSEAPGAYGGRSDSNPARLASYETASALASWPSPEMGVATRHVPSGNHSGMPPNLQPVVRPLFLRAGVALEQVSRHAVVFTDASATAGGPRTTGRQCQGCGRAPQRHWHINCLELLAVYLALGRLKGPLRGKHVLVRTDNTATVAYINCQGGLRSRRMSQLAPPSPPLESEASEVASRHSCPWCAQPCGRRALMSCAARRVATPPPGGPADLGGVRRSSGRPVCLARNLPLQVVLLPVPGEHSVQMHWRTAGPGAFAGMRFPQWAYLHRPCAKSGRTGNGSC